MAARSEVLGLVNVFDLELGSSVAHGGDGSIGFARIADASNIDGRINFIDVAVVPPGATIGRHRHADDEEEYYLVLAGNAEMELDGSWTTVRPGDLVRNPPGGTHQLRPIGDEPVRLFVFEVPTAGRDDRERP